MKPKRYISQAVIRRLPRYYRTLTRMEQKGTERISSIALGEELGLNPSQIRRDFSCFGEFGQQGYGYHVKKLRREIMRIMGLDRTHHMIILGMGNIGRALCSYDHFATNQFCVEAAFDIDPQIIGTVVEDLQIRDLQTLPEYAQTIPIDIAVLCTPSSGAQAALDLCVQAGIRGIWNFAPEDLSHEKDMIVENVHMTDSLRILSYRMHQEQHTKEIP